MVLPVWYVHLVIVKIITTTKRYVITTSKMVTKKHPKVVFFAAVDIIIFDMSTLSSESIDSLDKVERVERVELSCSTMSTQPKCIGSTRRTCRVESCRVEPSGIWALTIDGRN